jgi:hypothetical protein
MSRREITAVLFAASLAAAGAAIPALAQSFPPLRGTLDQQAGAGAEIPAPAPVVAKLAETKLEIEPLEPPPALPKRRVKTDPYAPLGIGNPGLRLYPSITVGAAYSSNVNNSHDDPQGDAGLLLKPALRLKSDWPRHALTAGLDGDLVYYRDHDQFDTRTLDVFQRLRLDVRRHTTAEIDTRYNIDQPAGEDASEHTLAGSVGVIHDFGPVNATLKGGARAKFFEDTDLAGGGTLDNGDRDYIEPSISVRASYALSGMLRPFIEATYAPRFHHTTPDRNGLDRDSEGYGLIAGVEVAAGPIWTGELGLTYLHRYYEDQNLDAVDALGFSGSLTWSPTELTRIVMATGTAIEEASSTATSATPTWNASVALTHAVRENIDVAASGSIEIEDLGSSFDKTYDASLGVSWKFNPVLAWTAGYDLTWLDAGRPDDSYVEHRIWTGLTVSR